MPLNQKQNKTNQMKLILLQDIINQLIVFIGNPFWDEY